MKSLLFTVLFLNLVAGVVAAGPDEGAPGWGALVGVPAFDQWIALAASNAPAIDIRRGNIDAAQATTARARAAGRPGLSVEGDWRVGRDKDIGRDPGIMTVEPFAGRARLEWELDVFGRVRQAVGAARYAEANAEWELKARELTLAASLAQHYVQGRYLAQQLNLRRRAAEANAAIAAYQANRATAGLARPDEADHARAATRAAEAHEAASREQWDLLAARWRYLAPTERVPPLDAHTGGVNTVPHAPAEDTLHTYALQRPDVRAAYAAWQEADRALIATARERTPAVTAIASAEGRGPSPVDNAEEWTAWAGIRLSLPVLAPERTADTRMARAQSQLAESIYQDAVSRALLDLRESYARRLRTEQSWQKARNAADLLRTRWTTMEQRHEKGLAALPAVENARLSWLTAEEQALALHAKTLQAHLSLVRACGGPQDR